MARKTVVLKSKASVLRYKRYCLALLFFVGVFLAMRRFRPEDTFRTVKEQQQGRMLRQLVVGEETKAEECQDPCPTCPPVQKQQQQPQPQPPSQQDSDNKNLITLPGIAASHAAFLVTVTSDGRKLVPEEYEDVSGFDFQFPKACADIKTWITKSSNQEQAITQLFQETFAQPVADAAASAANTMVIPIRPLFLDVGSNCGFFTILAAKAGMEVHAYDLQPTCTQHVASSATINNVQDRVQVFWAGMSDGVERAFEFSSFDSGCYGAFPARKQGPQGGPEVRVTLTSIDERYSTPTTTTTSRPIHMLKADTEGNEIKVMEGAMRTFQQHGIRKAIVEFTPHFWESRGFDKQSGIDALCKILGFGYTISWHLQKQELPDCDAVRTFFDGTWPPPLSRDLLFVSNKLESIRTELKTSNE